MRGNACLLNCGLILGEWEFFFFCFLNWFKLHEIQNEEFPVRCSSDGKSILAGKGGECEKHCKVLALVVRRQQPPLLSLC